MGLLYLVRHGETDYHVQRRALGRLDAPLNGLGARQAELVGEALGGKDVAAIYSSPLKRCRQTAQPLSERTGIRPEIVDGLQEIDLGEWDGLPFSDISRIGGEAFAQWLTEPAAVRIPGGETLGEVRERVLGAALDILGRHAAGENLVIVAHGGPLRLLICAALGLDANRLFRVELDLCSISSIRFFAGTIEENVSVAKVNDTCHLGAHRSGTRG